MEPALPRLSWERKGFGGTSEGQERGAVSSRNRVQLKLNTGTLLPEPDIAPKTPFLLSNRLRLHWGALTV